MIEKNDFAMADFTAEKARRVTETYIPELVNRKMGAILGMISSQAERGEYQLRVLVNDLSVVSLQQVRNLLVEMGYKVNQFVAPNSIDVTWYPPNDRMAE